MGLNARQVRLSRSQHGENRIETRRDGGLLREFLHGFSDPMIVILLVSMGLNLLFSGRAGLGESLAIFAAVLLSVTVSTLSEYRSARAFEALSESSRRLRARVRRDGTVQKIAAEQLCVGDVVLLCAGDVIPADGVMLCGKLSVNQSALNGESREVKKYPSLPARTPDDAGACFSSTSVTQGEGEMRVCAVGEQTLYGSLARELAGQSRKSPLKEKLSRLARTVSYLGYTAALLVAAVDLLYAAYTVGGGDMAGGFASFFASPTLLFSHLLHALTLAVTVTVVCVPEGLPMMITVVLSRQMRHMLREGVLLKKLAGLETAGAMDLLFCDKTGTLTVGHHEVEEVLSPTLRVLSETQPCFLRLCEAAFLNNRAETANGQAHGSNATDRALLDFTQRHGAWDRSRVRARLDFDSERKFAAVQLTDGRVLVKGAYEVVLQACTHQRDEAGVRTLTDAARDALTERLARREGRCLALAERQGGLSGDALGQGLILQGFFVLSDVLREQTAQTVARLSGAGVQVVMLTGDGEQAALRIAHRAGLWRPGALALSGEELRAMSEQALCEKLDRLCVVYRCIPTDKSRLTALAARAGRVCAMTGDGVNDCAALSSADVGFAMGSGSQVAKEAADVVLTDDRLSSIAACVLYGRTVYRSICKFIVFQLTMNFCAVSVSLVSPLFGIDTPITIAQMLWVNLIMDTLASLAFSGEPPRERYLSERPRRRDDAILSRAAAGQIAFFTAVCVGLCLIFFASPFLRTLYGFSNDPTPFLSAFFMLFVFLGIFNMINVRTERRALWEGLSRNRTFVLVLGFIVLVQLLLPLLFGRVIGCVPLPLSLTTLPIALALFILPADLIRKSILRGKNRS